MNNASPLTWALVCVIGALALFEAYLRLIAGPPDNAPDRLRSQSLLYQPTVYARHILPAMEQTVPSWREGTITVNQKGYRGKAFDAVKPPGTFRVMIYGGSSVFDLAVPGDDHWPQKTEDALVAGGLKNAQVINAGIPGHSGTDAATRLLTEGHFYQPDMALIYVGWNDIKYFQNPEPVLRDMQPIQTNPLFYFRNGWDRWLGERSWAYTQLRQLYLIRKFRIGAEGAANARANDLNTTPVLPEQTGRGPVQYEMNLRAFVDIARNMGAQPILVRQARLVSDQNTAEEIATMRLDYVGLDHAGLNAAYDQIDAVLDRVAADENVPLIDGAAMVPPSLEMFVDHVHLTPDGSARLADGLAQALANLIQAAR